jgi:hypothetical protein
MITTALRLPCLCDQRATILAVRRLDIAAKPPGIDFGLTAFPADLVLRDFGSIASRSLCAMTNEALYEVPRSRLSVVKYIVADYAFTLHGGESIIGAGLRGPIPPDPLHNLTFRDFAELGVNLTQDREFRERAFFFFGFIIYSDVLENRYKKGFGFIYSPERSAFLPFGGVAYNCDRKYEGEDEDKFPQIIA